MWPAATGNLAIPAAKAGARVSGIDIAPNLIAEAQLEARAAGVSVAFEVGRCRVVALSPGPVRHHGHHVRRDVRLPSGAGGGELIRVTRPGGRIAMANWTFEGSWGRCSRCTPAVVPPPQGVPSSLEWGKEAMVRARFGDKVSSVICSKRTLALDFPFPPAAVTELFANCYGPTVATLRAADTRRRQPAPRGPHSAVPRNTTWPPTAGRRWVGEYLDVQATVA
jgi:hypothetical protein